MQRSFSIRANEINTFVVESSAAQGKFIASQLQALGITQVKIFPDGNSALEAMDERKPDLTISAMHLADMSGSDLVNKMRADRRFAGIAFILITSEQNPHLLDAVRQAGACAILPKPFTSEQLSSAIASTLEYLNLETLEIGPDIDLDSLRVLVVDDSSSSRSYISQVLKTIGIRNITLAENGKLATGIVANQLFDLIITDYNMPEMNGHELVEFIRAKSWQSSVPILMMTSENNSARLAAVEQAGVTAICSKPFDAPTIKKLIEKALASS